MFDPKFTASTQINHEKLFQFFIFTCQLLMNDSNQQIFYGLNSLKNILLISESQPELKTQILSYLLSQNLHCFLISKLENQALHPFITKIILQIFNIIMKTQQEFINELISSNFHDLLVSLLPSKQALECIQTMFLLHEDYHNLLLTNHFHKHLLRYILSLDHIESPFKFFWESDYVSFLIFLQPYVQFDDADYEILIRRFILVIGIDEDELDFFHPNSTENPFYAVQKSYIKFLNNSEDGHLIELFCSQQDNLLYIISLFPKNTYKFIASKIFVYLEKIVCTSIEFASLFASPVFAEHFAMMLSNDSYLEEIVQLIFIICRELKAKCNEFVTEILFKALNSTLVSSSYSIQKTVFCTFLILLRNDPSCSYYPFFSDSQLFNYQTFFEFSDLFFDSGTTEKGILLETIFHILRNSQINPNLPLNQMFIQYILTADFYERLHKVIESVDNEEVSNQAKLLMEKIDELM